MKVFSTVFQKRSYFVFACFSIAVILATFDCAHGQNKQNLKESDLSEIKISMKRDGFPCGSVPVNKNDLSGCPAYSLVIDGTGNVIYEGVSSVKVIGIRTFKIPVSQVKQLLADFDSVGFFELKDRYTEKQIPNGSKSTVSHSNGTTIKLEIGNKSKSVYNFYGAPKGLNELQTKLDGISLKLQK